jgi:hypothetical protein
LLPIDSTRAPVTPSTLQDILVLNMLASPIHSRAASRNTISFLMR